MAVIDILLISLFILLLYVIPFLPFASIIFPERRPSHWLAVSLLMGIFVTTGIGYLTYMRDDFLDGGFFKYYIGAIVLLYAVTLIAVYFVQKHKVAADGETKKKSGKKKGDADKSVMKAYFLQWQKNVKEKKIVSLKPDIEHLFLAAALLLAVITRFSDPLSHVALNAADPYIHIMLMKEIIAPGFQLVSYNRYHWGFHFMLYNIYYLSGMDLYTIFRYLGAIFGVISVFTLYLFAKELTNRSCAVFCALAFGGLWLFERYFIWQTLTMPEIAASALLPVILLLVLGALKELTGSKARLARNLALVMPALLIYTLFHWVSLANLVYMTAALSGAFFIFNIKRFKSPRFWIMTVLVGITLAAVGFILAFTYTRYIGDMGVTEFLKDLFKTKRWDLTMNNVAGVGLGIAVGILGILRKRFGYFYLGIASLFMGFIHITGSMFPSGIPYRSGLFFTMIMALDIGVALYEFSHRYGLYFLVNKFAKRAKKQLPKVKLQMAHYFLLIPVIAGYLGYVFGGIAAAAICLLLGAGVALGVVLMLRKGRTSGKDAMRSAGERGDDRNDRHGSEPYAFRALCVLAILLVCLFPPPQADKDYYKYTYDGNIAATLKVMDQYPLENCTFYYQSTNPSTNQVGDLVYPEGAIGTLTDLLRLDPDRTAPSIVNRTYYFIYTEHPPLPKIEDYNYTAYYKDYIYPNRMAAETQIGPWLLRFMVNNTVTVFYEDEYVTVYLYSKVPD